MGSFCAVRTIGAVRSYMNQEPYFRNGDVSMKIYELLHMHGSDTLQDGRFHYGETSMLGFFRSWNSVQAAIAQYREISGFRDYPNGFFVFEHQAEDTECVYFAQFYAHDAGFEFEFVKSLGIFTNEHDAGLALERFRQNNADDWANLIIELSVDSYRLDEMHCTYGFYAE